MNLKMTNYPQNKILGMIQYTLSLIALVSVGFVLDVFVRGGYGIHVGVVALRTLASVIVLLLVLELNFYLVDLLSTKTKNPL